ncbi:hypothetical protein RRG08_015167 [Elysia crispata]|uniref:Uncharacterized protein n=1 Tax=Elysia crispata TaxID=231223 RepID=A0AAE1B093_9GAST|nr:hypothetical protein RRG08_015167 [Elysia crispata]
MMETNPCTYTALTTLTSFEEKNSWLQIYSDCEISMYLHPKRPQFPQTVNWWIKKLFGSLVLQEIANLNACQGPNVVSFLDAWQEASPSGRDNLWHYIVMESCGCSLRDVIDAYPEGLPVPAVKSINGLVYAHCPEGFYAADCTLPFWYFSPEHLARRSNCSMEMDF